MKKFFVRIFWPSFFILLALSLALALWAGNPKQVGYREMACTFEERVPGCLDSVAEWKDGLAFFDSAYAVNGDALQSLKSLLWSYWNIEFAGAGEAAVTHDAVFPLRTLANRKGGCMGISWLALMVAEARHLPLTAVLLPGHVFLRYGHDDGRAQVGFAPKTVNLEPNRRGLVPPRRGILPGISGNIGESGHRQGQVAGGSPVLIFLYWAYVF